jgi:hypothetical protein
MGLSRTVSVRNPAVRAVTALGAAAPSNQIDHKPRAAHQQYEQCDYSNDRGPGGENQDQPDQGGGNRQINQ